MDLDSSEIMVVENCWSNEVTVVFVCDFIVFFLKFIIWLSKKHDDETRSTVADAAVLTDSSIQLFADRVGHYAFL